MKIPALILILTVCISCKNSTNTNTSTDTSTVNKQSASLSIPSNRRLMIQELKRIKAAFASRDKERIADIFPFPIPDSVMGTIEYDSTALKEFNEKGGRTTREMFIKYFDENYKYLQMEQINELFKYLDIDKLNHADTLTHEVRSKKEPCYKYYEIHVSEDAVTFIFGTNGNSEYVDPEKKSNDDETIGDECEFASFWTFKFDGKKLHFDHQTSAG